MAILSFALTTKEFLSGKKTVTRRNWKKENLFRWQKFWDEEKLTHDAWDKVPYAGGKKIGRLSLTARPYLERLRDMPFSDLEAEGGMCKTFEEYFKLIGKTSDDIVSVIRFIKIKE